MKTLKKIILAAMFTAALTAFIACANDDRSENGNSSNQPTLPDTPEENSQDIFAGKTFYTEDEKYEFSNSGTVTIYDYDEDENPQYIVKTEAKYSLNSNQVSVQVLKIAGDKGTELMNLAESKEYIYGEEQTAIIKKMLEDPEVKALVIRKFGLSETSSDSVILKAVQDNMIKQCEEEFNRIRTYSYKENDGKDGYTITEVLDNESDFTKLVFDGYFSGTTEITPSEIISGNYALATMSISYSREYGDYNSKAGKFYNLEKIDSSKIYFTGYGEELSFSYTTSGSGNKMEITVTLDDGSKLVLKYNPEEIILFNDEDKAHSFH